MRVHEEAVNMGSLPCKFCGMKTKNLRNLRRHIEAIHIGIRYPCDQCDHKATQMSSLKLHVKRMHKRILICKHCNLKLSSKTELRNHIIAQHSAGDIYPCNQCDYLATKREHLKQHMESVHEKIRNTCKFCHIEFYDKSVLNRHIKSVHIGIRYQCDQCDFEATQKSNLKKHVERMHACNL